MARILYSSSTNETNVPQVGGQRRTGNQQLGYRAAGDARLGGHLADSASMPTN